MAAGHLPGSWPDWGGRKGECGRSGDEPLARVPGEAGAPAGQAAVDLKAVGATGVGVAQEPTTQRAPARHRIAQREDQIGVEGHRADLTVNTEVEPATLAAGDGE